VPITANRLSKIERKAIVAKIMAKVKLWSLKSISYISRVMLISTIRFGMFNFWAFVFPWPGGY